MIDIGARLQSIRNRMADAIARRGPGPRVVLCGVGKRHSSEAVHAAAIAGLRDVGENYAQEYRDKRAALADVELRWHFIGPVQSNKVKLVAGCACIHTIDRPELLAALERRCRKLATIQSVLIQVNIGLEPQKHGVAPAQVGELLDRVADLDAVRVNGLMCIPPIGEPAASRLHFAAMRQLRERLAAKSRPGVELDILSMGMSEDFEVAIEEGASLVRVGSALFGPRPT